MRFFLDENVEYEVARRLKTLGHEAWSAVDAGLSSSNDDEVTVYAQDHNAILLTHDREFSARRRKNVVGFHVELRCPETEAAELLTKRIDTILDLVSRFDDVFISLSKERLDMSHRWDKQAC